MAEKTENKGFARGTLEETSGQLKKALASKVVRWIMLALTGILAALAEGVRELPDPIRWMLWGVLLFAGLLTLAMFATGAYRHRKRRREIAMVPESDLTPVLAVDPRIDSLAYAYPLGQSGYLISAGFLNRDFAVLAIRNEGRQDLHKVVARCSLTDTEMPCFWSSSEDGKFALGGSVSADLDVWHQRVLVIAQVFKEMKLWARLPADPANLFHPPAIREKEVAEWTGEARVISPAGERLDLGGKAMLTVNFGAGSFRHTERFLLSFDSDGPTITREP